MTSLDMTSRPASKWLIAAAVTFGAFMGAVDTSVMNVALPHLRGVFSATTEEISWVSTGYLLSAAVAMPLAAWLGRRLGRRRLCLGGLALFILSSVACGMARDLSFLVLARIVQGIGAGILVPIEQTILRETFPPREQGLAMGIYGMTIMLGPALGPALAGYCIDHLTWPWVFYVNIPVGLVGLAMVSAFIHDPPGFRGSRPGIDAAGILLLVAGLWALHLLLERGQRLDWFETRTNIYLLFVAVFGLAMFVAHELSTAKPVIDLRVLADGAFASAVVIGTVLGFVVMATLFLLPIFMQDVLRYSAVRTGMMLMPRALVMVAAFPLVGALHGKVPPRLLIAAGLALGAYSAALMSGFDRDTGGANLLAPQILQGLAVALTLTPLSTMALATIPRERLAAAAGLNNLARQLGGSLGIALFATLVERFSTQARGALIHNLMAGAPVLRRRLADVGHYFWTLGGIDNSVAYDRALHRLDGRFQGEVTVIAFDHCFQWIALLFVLMLPLTLILRSPSHARH